MIAGSRSRVLVALLLALSMLSACKVGTADQPPKESPPASVGPAPSLPPPDKQTVPVVNVAEARGWPEGKVPIAAPGVKVTAFASGLAHPRWLLTLPNGDVLVAETAAPERPAAGQGIRGKFMQKFMKKAGSAVPSANRLTLLRDADADGVAELKTEFLTGLHSPFGMALVGNELYVANTDGIVKFAYTSGATRLAGRGQPLVDLPAGELNHHWTKNILASRDGRKLYATVGSNSNVAENGMAAEEGRAAIWEIDIATGKKRLFATGLRNPNGLAWEPGSGELWTVVNERDELGDDLVPDYLTSVRDGGFYGWPYSYFGQQVDSRVEPARPDLVAKAIAPDFALGAHVAALGLVHTERNALPEQFWNGMFIGEHGSWNRSELAGYKVVFVPFRAGKPHGMPLDVLVGFVSEKGEAWGRPVGVALDRSGALLVADDVGNTVWRASENRTLAGPGASRTP